MKINYLSRMKSVALIGIASLSFSGIAHAQTWFRANFENLNESRANLYNFANRYAQSTTTWETTHTTNGGWNGSGAPHIVVHGCGTGANCTTHNQFNTGWVTPPLSKTFTMGESAFLRFRIKFDPNSTFPVDAFITKLILMGTTGTEPNSRIIIHLAPAFRNQGCTLGFDYQYMGWTPPASIWTDYQDWGLSANFDRTPIAGQYVTIMPNVNITWSCAPGVLLTRSNHPSPVPKPQGTGAAPVGGWYHLQFQATSGANGQSGFSVWANNNSQSNPSSRRTNMPDGLGVTGWSSGIDVGGYWGTGLANDLGYTIDDFEVGGSFDPNWYPASGPRPSPVTDVR